MGMKLMNRSGQMTVEFAVVFPVLLIIATIAINALMFFAECASFDRVARDAVRIHATSPTYGQATDQSSAQIAQELDTHFDKEYLNCSVTATEESWGHVMYRMTLTFEPNLFGMGLRSEILGVALPRLTHEARLTVDPYKAGVLL